MVTQPGSNLRWNAGSNPVAAAKHARKNRRLALAYGKTLHAQNAVWGCFSGFLATEALPKGD